MITFLNFNSRQLQDNEGFKRKIKKVSKKMGIKEILYSEIINVEQSSIDVLIVDELMYFHKITLYSDEAVKMLDSEFSKSISALADNKDDLLSTMNQQENCNLLFSIESLISRCMQQLNIENSSNIDKLENSVSSQFDVTIKDFTYDEIYKSLEPLVKRFIPDLFRFKIINLTKTSAEIMAITTECKLFQYQLNFDIKYIKFFNRYLSAILRYEEFVVMKRNLKKYNFTRALKETLPLYDSEKEKLDTLSFLSFLLNHFRVNVKDEGAGPEGLKNFYKFFLDTSSSEREAKEKVRACFLQVKTYAEKQNI